MFDSHRDKRRLAPLRRALAGAAALALLTAPALAQGGLFPPGFFDRVPAADDSAAEIEADVLAYDGNTRVVTARGNVVILYQGYRATADHLVYNQQTGAVQLIGNVVMHEPGGVVYTAETADVTGGMKAAFLRALTITTPGGGLVTAEDADYDAALRTILTQTSYAPCGLCIDSKGRRIGWRVKAAKVVYDKETRTTYLEQPTLELLGLPVAWLPFLWLPDLSTEVPEGLRMPSYGFDEQTGYWLEVPYFMALGNDTDLVLAPTVLSRQGFLMGAEVTHRFPIGTVSVKASGIRQNDPAAFAGEVGEREWRGAIQSAGRFTPLKHWTVGWSHTAFTDAAFLTDYRLTTADDAVSEVYATYLDRDSYGDVRLQQFNLFDTSPTQANQALQARALPNARYDNVTQLGNGNGQVRIGARLLGVQRGADHTATIGGVPFVFGYEGNKVHGTIEAGWQNQWVGPSGLLFSPYLGLRGDAAHYDGTPDATKVPDLPGDAYADTPADQSLFSVTPIAAMDVRLPLMAHHGGNVHIVEPIAQLAYRGSDVTTPGITNDNAQSFVFDDSNLFSYDRFTGTDRQETGLRANVGVRYQADFADGGWLELLAGQSYHLAGVNSLGVADAAQVGANTGLGDDASYVVLGAKGTLFGLATGGGKLIIDPADGEIARAGLEVRYANADGYTLDLGYTYLAADPALGKTVAQNEIGALASVPIADYWRLNGGVYWDLNASTWLEARAGITYDDGYLLLGANYTATGPTHSSPNDHKFLASFRLKGPDGTDFGYSGPLPGLP